MKITPHQRVCRRGRAGRQRGLSLIELMVAVAISLFVMIAFVGIFVNMKSTFLSQDRLSQLQDNERLALTILGNTIQAAGYFPDPTTSTADAPDNLPLKAANGNRPSMLAGQSVTGKVLSSTSHTITSRFTTGAGETDPTNCFGKANTTTGKLAMINTFSLNGSNELVCTVEGVGSNAIVGNVKELTALYLIDTGVGYRYLRADQIAATDWAKVKMVRITLIFFNPHPDDPNASTTPVTWVQTINLMNRTS